MIVYMRGVWGLLPKVGALVLVFGGTVKAVDQFRCHDSFNPVVVDSQLDCRVDSYVQVVRQTKHVLKHSKLEASKLRELGNTWINGSKEGKLLQIYPGYCGESLVEGPKGDVFATCASLANRISDLAEREAAANDPQAFEDAIRSIELINIIRFGNYETLFTSSSYLRRPIKILKNNIDKLSPTLAAKLDAIQNPKVRDYKTDLLNQVAKRQKTQYAARYGAEMAQQDDNNYAFFLNNNPRHIAASHFYGFDREKALVATKGK